MADIEETTREERFSDRLRRLRLERKLRQIDLARTLSLAQTTIANYERGTRFPDEDALHRFADYFRVTLDYLLGRSPEKGDEPQESEPYAGTVAGSGTESDGMALQAAGSAFEQLKADYLDALLGGDTKRARILVDAAADSGSTVRDIYVGVFAPVLNEVGRLWMASEVGVATEHFVSEVTKDLMAHLASKSRKEVRPAGHVLLMLSAGGELHDIGLKMVSDLLELDGYEVYYLGVNVPSNEVIAMIIEHHVDILGISVTITEHMEAATLLIRAIRGVAATASTLIMVGGRAFNHSPSTLWSEMGADGWAPDAVDAIACVRRLLGEA